MIISTMLKEFKVLPSNNSNLIAFHWFAGIDSNEKLIWVPELWVDIMYVLPDVGKPTVIVRLPGTKTFITNFGRCKIYGTRITLKSGIRRQSLLKLSSKRLENNDTFVKYTKAIEELVETVNELSSTEPLSGRQERRRFKEQYGLTRTGLTELAEIHRFLGEKCGSTPLKSHISDNLDYAKYYDQPHFIRHFKKMIGMTPSIFFRNFCGLPEQLMAISYKYQVDVTGILKNILRKE